MLTINANVTSFVCTTAAPEECCNLVTEGEGDLAYQFCLGICILCCETCEIKWETGDNRQSEWTNAFPTAVPSRNFPDFVPTFGGVSFTTSEYGKFLPIVFGSDKLTGNVFWSSGFDDHEFTGSDGVAYYYTTTSFAIGICEGEINGVLRMWLGDLLIMDNTAEVDGNGEMQPAADGFIAGATVNLTDRDSPLRQLTSAEQTTIITVFSGTATQLPEGVMADVEGYELTPAYRNVSYVLFENFVVTESSIPNLFVEVTANTEILYPRLEGNIEAPFDDILNGMYIGANYPCVLDQSYNRLYVYGTGDGTTTPANGNGILIFDSSSMAQVGAIEFETRVNAADANRGFWLTTKSDLLFINGNGNGAELFTVNPFSGQGSPVIGGMSANDQITDSTLSTYGFKALFGEYCHMTYGQGINGSPVDIFVAQGFISETIGFCQVDPITGAVLPVFILPGYFPNDGIPRYTRSTRPSSSQAGENPTFPDGVTPTAGHHVFVFKKSASLTGIEVWRFTIEGIGSTLVNPTYSQLATDIPATEFGGNNFAIDIENVILDTTDNNFIIFIGRGTVADRVIKWNPFTETVLWSKTLPGDREIHGFTPGTENGIVGAGTMVFFANASFAGPIIKLNTLTGDMEITVESTTSQSLPTHQFVGSVYNSYENALFYLSGDNSGTACKVFVDRITRSTVELSDIVRSLLNRVNYQITDLDLTDLDTLTLRGYTISKITSLRAIFSELQQVFKFDVLESNGRILFKARGDAAIRTIPESDMADTNEFGWFEETQTNDFSRKRKINLTYRDLDREYAANVQTVILPKIDNSDFDEDAGIDVTVPIVLIAEEAKKLAEILLYAKNVYNSTYRGELGTQHIDLDPGDVVEISMDDGTSTNMRFRETTIGTDRTMKFVGVKEDPDIYNDQVNLFGETGRYTTPGIPRPQPRIDPFFLNVPFASDVQAGISTTDYLFLLTFLNSNSSDTLQSDVTILFNGTDRVTVSPPVSNPTWGYVSTAIPAGASTSWNATDFKNSFTVFMMSETGASLTDQTVDDLIADNTLNLCYVGGELMQFSTVVDNGDGSYTFSGLNRALFGTDQWLNAHTYGERFIMLDPTSYLVIPVSTSILASSKTAGQVFVNNRNPFQPPFIQYMVSTNLRPFSVTTLSAVYSTGDAVVTWTWRPRYGTDCLEEIENSGPTNVEQLVEFTIWFYSDPTVFDPYNVDTYLRTAVVTDPTDTYTQVDQTADGFDNTTDTLYYLVAQTGSHTGKEVGTAAQRALDPVP